MEPFTIDTILPIASGALFTTQAVYYLGLYNKLYTHSRETAYATDINTQILHCLSSLWQKTQPTNYKKTSHLFRAGLSGIRSDCDLRPPGG